MKNPHGVEPTRYMNRKGRYCAIICYPGCGPIFGSDIAFFDIYIGDNCTEENSCLIWNNGVWGYECHPQFKSSLFVNTNKPDKMNLFSVLDYEVYTHD